MGKSIKESRTEIDKCAWTIEYFADNAELFLRGEVINADERKSTITFESLGVILNFSPETIKNSIEEGEIETNQAIEDLE